ncbi:MAG: hypothetical protein ACXWPM_10630 [Bdellovibrionota bacterium]
MALNLSWALTPARADDVYTVTVKKQEQKEQNRWSLQDWLTTKEKFRAQDAWLAMHTPSPWEFYVGGDFLMMTQSPGTTSFGWKAIFGVYVYIFGLETQFESIADYKAQGTFLLRIFGYHAQATNLTLQFGLREEFAYNLSYDYRQLFAGARFAFYFIKYIGVEGDYRHYFNSTPNNLGAVISGDRIEAGAFFDYSIFRVYGDFIWEPDYFVGASSSTVTSMGFQAGVKVFF